MLETPVFEVRSLSVAFSERGNTTSILEKVSLSFYSGKITAVIGASGSGKSVLAHALLDLLPKTARVSGEMFYKGMPLTQKQISILRGRELFLVPQSVTSLDPLRRVSEQLRDGAPPDPGRMRAQKVLDRYGLGNAGKLYPFELSGGMARRVLIATAVMGHPCFVIADEPTTGLDHRSARWVLQHFREIAQEGAAVLLITHDLELALTVADRVAVFYSGMLLEEGAAQDFMVRDTLRHPYTKALWDAMPKNGFLSAPDSQGKSVTSGCVYAPHCPFAESDCEETIPLTTLRGGVVRCRKAL